MLFALLITPVLSNLLAERTFHHFTQAFGKSYSPAEYAHRQEIFAKTLQEIEAHNANPSNTWKMGITEYTDWTEEEFASNRLSDPQDCSATEGSFKAFDLGWLPTSVDWRAMGVVTPVKNQGSCGSCWAFSTTAALESHWAIVKKQGLVDLSEQQLVDCAGNFNNFGCSGGLPSQAFEYIKYNGGITSETDYPYTATNGACYFNKTTPIIAHAKGGSHNITYLDEYSLQHAIAFNGPVSIAFQVISGFKQYAGGVYSSPLCSNLPDQVNHAVLAVGFSVDQNGQEYYIVKNSWGTNWGMSGYFWLQRGTNMCGVADCASFPIVD